MASGAQCIPPPGGILIHFRNTENRATGGNLDVDIRHPTRGQIAVENITWPDKSNMREGEYLFYVNNFARRGGKSGFRAEIEFDGQVFQFEHAAPLRQDQNVEVAKVTYSKKEGFSIKPILPSSSASRTAWGLETAQYHPVYVVMHSPNYWDENTGHGHKHYFFMLKGCVCDEQPNGFFNEYLPDSLNPHRRVLEALGTKMSVEQVDDQLSGLGFSSTKRNHLVVKVAGSFTRILKIVF